MNHINKIQNQAMEFLYSQPANSFVEMSRRFSENGNLTLLKLTGFVRQRITNNGITYCLTQKGREYVEAHRNGSSQKV